MNSEKQTLDSVHWKQWVGIQPGGGGGLKRGEMGVPRKLSSPRASTSSQGEVVPRTKTTWGRQIECKPV